MPDIFVPNDVSAGITSYYINVANAGLFAEIYPRVLCDLNHD